jgi:hypothetical protein
VTGAELRAGDDVFVSGYGWHRIVEAGEPDADGFVPVLARTWDGRTARMRLAGDYDWPVRRHGT